MGSRRFLFGVAAVATFATVMNAVMSTTDVFYRNILEKGFTFEFDSKKPLSAPSGIVPLAELTGGNKGGVITCPPMMSPVYDRIVEPNATLPDQNIPRQIHVAWVRGHYDPLSRCMPDDYVKWTDRWKEQFPSWSFYFHDDRAVDQLLFGQEWPQFPHLQMILRHCVKFGGAVKIDVWRVVVLYIYGGLYSDIDSVVPRSITERNFSASDSAWFLSDSRNRPSQGCQAMEANHPIAYYTILEILTRLLAKQDISDMKPVYVTGPTALRDGYTKVMGHMEPGVHCTNFTGCVRKIDRKDGQIEGFNVEEKEHVQWNETLTVTKRQRVNMLLNTKHWLQQIKIEAANVPKQSCWRQLYDNLGRL